MQDLNSAMRPAAFPFQKSLRVFIPQQRRAGLGLGVLGSMFLIFLPVSPLSAKALGQDPEMAHLIIPSVFG